MSGQNLSSMANKSLKSSEPQHSAPMTNAAISLLADKATVSQIVVKMEDGSILITSGGISDETGFWTRCSSFEP